MRKVKKDSGPIGSALTSSSASRVFMRKSAPRRRSRSALGGLVSGRRTGSRLARSRKPVQLVEKSDKPCKRFIFLHGTLPLSRTNRGVDIAKLYGSVRKSADSKKWPSVWIRSRYLH